MILIPNFKQETVMYDIFFFKTKTITHNNIPGEGKKNVS